MVLTRASNRNARNREAPRVSEPVDSPGVHLNAADGPTAVGFDYRVCQNNGAAAQGQASPPIVLQRRRVPFNPSRPQWGDAGTGHKWARKTSEFAWCTVNYAVQHLPKDLQPRKYAHHPHREKDCEFDFTGYLPHQRSWGEERLNGRPDVLFMLQHPETWEDTFDAPSEFLKVIDRGIERVIVDEDDYDMTPLDDIPDCPFPVSRSIEGWRMEAWKRIDRRITSQELCRRMISKLDRDGHRLDKPKPETLNRRRNAFRDSAFCPAWGQGRSAIWDFTLDKLRQVGRPSNNSTRYIDHDLDRTEAQYLAARQYIDHGKQSRAGTRMLMGPERERKRRQYENVIADFERQKESHSIDVENVDYDPVPSFKRQRRPTHSNQPTGSKRAKSKKDQGQRSCKRARKSGRRETREFTEAIGALVMHVARPSSNTQGFTDTEVFEMQNQVFHRFVRNKDVDFQNQETEDDEEAEVSDLQDYQRPQHNLSDRGIGLSESPGSRARALDSLPPVPPSSSSLYACSHPLPIMTMDPTQGRIGGPNHMGIGTAITGWHHPQPDLHHDSANGNFEEYEQENWYPHEEEDVSDHGDFFEGFSFGGQFLPFSPLPPGRI